VTLEIPSDDGLNMRDRFAMAALTGMIARGRADTSLEESVALAYEVADKMLAAREQEQS